MVNEILSLILRTNIALAVCVLLVLALRSPTRRLAGARIAYALWSIPPLAAAACLLPARVEVIKLPANLPIDLAAAPVAHTAAASLDLRYVLAAWIGGVAVSSIVLILRQTRFARALGRLSQRGDLGEGVVAAESSEHGPAVLGVLRPVIVTPADFDARFSEEERRIVIQHERAHVAQGDPLINATAALLQCVNWFNPLVHIGVRALRLDQELACDAAVLATAARRSYAEAILKTQIAAGAPLGCAWPSTSLSALKERIAMLKNNLPTRTQRILGVSAIGLASFTACAVAWAAQPARVVVAQANATPAQAAMPPTVPLPPDPLAVPAAYAAPASSAATSAYAEAALAGADPQAQPDAANDADAENETDADVDVRDITDDPDLAALDDPDHELTIVDDNGHVSHRRLTTQERERIRVAIRQAMDAHRVALANARVAMVDAQRQIREAHIAEAAARGAALNVEMAHRAEALMDSPEMRAEIAALTAAAARMEAERADMNAAQREALRADMRQHEQRIREMARRFRDEAQAEHDRARRDGDSHD